MSCRKTLRVAQPIGPVLEQMNERKDSAELAQIARTIDAIGERGRAACGVDAVAAPPRLSNRGGKLRQVVPRNAFSRSFRTARITDDLPTPSGPKSRT